MINAPLIMKINEYVKKVPNYKWDYATIIGRGLLCRKCWLGHGMSINNRVIQDELGFNILGIPTPVYYRLFLRSRIYGGNMYKVKKKQVCSLVDRYVTYKLRQEHKWKQYEYEKFGKQVTDKRGICI